MTKFHVPRISCVGCMNAVTKAVKGVDTNATVNVDLGNKIVAVESTVSADTVAAALSAAGYPPQRQLA